MNNYPKVPHIVIAICHQNESLRDHSRSLPLTRYHTKLVPEVLQLQSGQRLGQYVRDLLIHSNVKKLHSSFLHHVANVLVFDLDMLGLS